MRVEALEGFRVPGAADPERERGATVGGVAFGELAADGALLLRGPLEAGPEVIVRPDRRAPPLDASGGLEPRDRGDQMTAGQPVRRRERLALGCVGRLFRDGGAPERAADDDAEERPRLAAQLCGDD